MIPTPKSKINFIERDFSTVVVLICFLFLLFQSQKSHAEMKKASGTSTVLSTLHAVETNRLQADVRFVNKLAEWRSRDPIWDKTKIFSSTKII